MNCLLNKFTFRNIIAIYFFGTLLYLISEWLLWSIEAFIISTIVWVLSCVIKLIGIIAAIFHCIKIWFDGISNKTVVLARILFFVILFLVLEYLPLYILSFFDLEITG